MKRTSWDSICSESIRKEKEEIAKRYNIRFGQTTIYCARCGKSCWPGSHTCGDIRLRALTERKKRKAAEAKAEKTLEVVLKRGRTMTALMLGIKENTVRRWIDRGKVPKKYQAEVSKLEIGEMAL